MDLKNQLDETKIESMELSKKVANLEALLSKNKQQTEFLKFEKKKLKETFALKENQVIEQYESELKDKNELLCRLSEEREKEIEFQKKKEEKLQVISFCNLTINF